jgi:hypothetical protein
LINNIVSSCTNPYFSLNSNNSIKNRWITFQGVSGNYARTLNPVGVTNSDFTIVMKVEVSGTQSGMIVGPVWNGSDNWLKFNSNSVFEVYVTESADVRSRAYFTNLSQNSDSRIIGVSFLWGNGYVYTPEKTYPFLDNTYQRAPFSWQYYFWQRSTGQFSYNGSIQEVRVYNRHLTENEFMVLQNQLQ